MFVTKLTIFIKKNMKYKNLRKQYFYMMIVGIASLLITNCAPKKYNNTKINTAYIEVANTIESNSAIDAFLKPYSDHISNDLSKALAYNPYDLDKTAAKWQNPMTNFYADAILEIALPVFEKQTGKKIDFCLLNYGGIRATIAKGAITTRTAYDIMPFENNAVVLALKGNVVYEMAHFIIANKVAHPLSGIEIFVDKNQMVKDIKINNESIDKNKTYHMVTNDYLAKGGDKMNFLLKAKENHSLNYKLRNMFIAYFTKIDTLNPSVKPRIIFE